jgi:hypothetical protein
VFLLNLLNVLVQIPNKIGIKKNILTDTHEKEIQFNFAAIGVESRNIAACKILYTTTTYCYRSV